VFAAITSIGFGVLGQERRVEKTAPKNLNNRITQFMISYSSVTLLISKNAVTHLDTLIVRLRTGPPTLPHTNGGTRLFQSILTRPN
jgi:hypothetical protein